MNGRHDVYLASSSPRRQELLQQIGVRFQVVKVDVPEHRQGVESPEYYVRRLAQAKAQAAAEVYGDRPVLGADTICVLGSDGVGQRVLEKPLSRAHGIEMLLAMSGETQYVRTAVCLSYQGRSECLLNTTAVVFRSISEREAIQYWDTGEPLDKAGGYGIQGRAAVFVEQIQGSYSSVVGLPLFETAQLLTAFEVPIWQE